MPINLSGRTEGQAKNGHGWLDGPTDPCTDAKMVFRASDGRTDGQPENIMPPAPESRGMKISFLLS